MEKSLYQKVIVILQRKLFVNLGMMCCINFIVLFAGTV
jgi:hypothetical protein